MNKRGVSLKPRISITLITTILLLTQVTLCPTITAETLISNVASVQATSDKKLEKSLASVNSLRSSRSLEPDQKSRSLGERSNSILVLSGETVAIPCTNIANNRREPIGTSPEFRKHNFNISGRRATGQRVNSVRNTRALTQVPYSVILFYKDDKLDSPIFTIDARNSMTPREVKQSIIQDSLIGRASFEQIQWTHGINSSALVIAEATKKDSGLYTCNMEFPKSPTQIYQIEVRVITPPGNLVILDELNKPTTSIIGPYDEESRQTFTCEADAGDPIGKVSWWSLESTFTVTSLPAVQFVSSPSHRTFNKQWIVQNLSDIDFDELPNYLTTISLKDGQDVTNSIAKEYFHAFSSDGLLSNPRLVADRVSLPSDMSATLKFWKRETNATFESVLNNVGRIQSNLQVTLKATKPIYEFLCLANNNNHSLPSNASIRIDLNTKPTEVKIVNRSELVFILGKKMVVQCQVIGSRPYARIRWFRESREVISNDQKIQMDLKSLELTSNDDDEQVVEFSRSLDNMTQSSYLTLKPTLHDNQQELRCSAKNEVIENSRDLYDSITMNVQYPPILSLEFGANLSEDSLITVGTDIFMVCHIQSNPPIEEIVWLFDEKPIESNISDGLIISNQSLAIQKIKIEHRGHYQCLARNSLGKSTSNKIELRPKFKPVCDYSQTKRNYEVRLNEPTRIECNVKAEPNEHIFYTWKLNRTVGASYHIEDLKRYENNLTTSWFMFSPTNRGQYGQLLCSARNSVGQQEESCVIQVIPSEAPDPIAGCFFENLTYNSFDVHCQSPTRRQANIRHQYLLELYVNDSTILREIEPNQREPLKKIVSDSPSFYVKDLETSANYNVFIYVLYPKGRSAPLSYQISTLTEDSTETLPKNISNGTIAELDSTNSTKRMILITLVSIFLVLLVWCVVIFTFCRRVKSSHLRSRHKSRKNSVGPAMSSNERVVNSRQMTSINTKDGLESVSGNTGGKDKTESSTLCPRLEETSHKLKHFQIRSLDYPKKTYDGPIGCSTNLERGESSLNTWQLGSEVRYSPLELSDKAPIQGKLYSLTRTASVCGMERNCDLIADFLTTSRASTLDRNDYIANNHNCLISKMVDVAVHHQALNESTINNQHDLIYVMPNQFDGPSSQVKIVNYPCYWDQCNDVIHHQSDMPINGLTSSSIATGDSFDATTATNSLSINRCELVGPDIEPTSRYQKFQHQRAIFPLANSMPSPVSPIESQTSENLEEFHFQKEELNDNQGHWAHANRNDSSKCIDYLVTKSDEKARDTSQKELCHRKLDDIWRRDCLIDPNWTRRSSLDGLVMLSRGDSISQKSKHRVKFDRDTIRNPIYSKELNQDSCL